MSKIKFGSSENGIRWGSEKVIERDNIRNILLIEWEQSILIFQHGIMIHVSSSTCRT